MFLHFTGATQYAMALAKDKSSFVSAVNYNEEETKKEKDTKEEITDLINDSLITVYSLYRNAQFGTSITGALADEDIKHQFVAEQLTPPPNFKG